MGIENSSSTLFRPMDAFTHSAVHHIVKSTVSYARSWSSNLGCSCVNLKKLFNLSVLYFVHLIGRDKDSTYLIEICDSWVSECNIPGTSMLLLLWSLMYIFSYMYMFICIFAESTDIKMAQSCPPGDLQNVFKNQLNLLWN